MTILIVMTALALFSVTGAGSILIAPQTAFELGFTSEEPPVCREYSDAELDSEVAAKGKAATWKLGGKFVCQRSIFEYGDRDSFYDFAVNAAPEHARLIGNRLMQLPLSEDRRIELQVFADDPKLIQHLRTVYFQRLHSVFGGVRVVRQGGSEGAPRIILTISVRRVSAEDLLFSAMVVQMDEDGGGRHWQL